MRTKMKTKVVRIRIDSETETRLKNVAASEGKSVSETIRSLIMQSLESSFKHVAPGSGIDPEMILSRIETAIKSSPGSGSGIDPEQVKKEIGSVLGNALKPILETLTILRAEGVGGSPGKGSEIDPALIRFLTEKVSFTNALLIGVSSKMAGTYIADHSDRMKQAKAVVASEMREISGGAR
ncbi:MAG: Hypothetical protein C75L2_00030089 [Leptospirillum sp. Group II 'C75']|jgi:hypothetical protein|uniref:Uncharacterized protein n=1 Tax=Leptospirillum sp. Group II '5-way CG' TaxID=419541 RepID=B6AM19_9BACT|nr:hypothetical protein [Leptospirillum sp. Group II 'CF-1']AKS22739.1 hypothetical protein ABH19_01690 [Leptospirillum sp. Group II 'CF-1']EDZ39526.1 MAG: Hypothetical protein CGL2_11277165 [Leptospirillum sp. Group II '5-way CG']EIJ77091.1 MAG: Hypothetical protein C75L2_00030089 [Leptospirillum sp. Group II 'C75']